MIAPLRTKSRYTKEQADAVPAFEELLAKMMPYFQAFATKELKLRGDNLDECVQDLTCMAYRFYTSLVERGLADRIFHTPIMLFAAGRFREGRHFTGSNSTDVLGDTCRLRKRVEVESLEPYDEEKGTWRECFVTDGRINVAREVAFKIDCEDWMATFDRRRRKMLDAMIMGDTTNEP